ncbi:MAG TPA: hypothetical protein PK156_43150, partial [Polyangium sp.]|nr:hypothetical protein [Polyangium sp.]
MSTRVRRWWVIALIGMATSMSCGDTAPNDFPTATDATETAHEASTGNAPMTPELRSTYIAAVQNDAGATYHAEREVSGAARFVHP